MLWGLWDLAQQSVRVSRHAIVDADIGPLLFLRLERRLLALNSEEGEADFLVR